MLLISQWFKFIMKIVHCVLRVWQYELWSFLAGVQNQKDLLQNQHTQRKLLNLENWVKQGVGSQTGTEGSGKNKKKLFFLLGLKYTLRTCFESKNFLPKSCPELSNQVLSFSACQVYQQFRVRVRHSFFNILTSGGQVWT